MGCHITGTLNTTLTPCNTPLEQISQHLVNHLWHFPLGVGAQRLSSLVVESDDLPAPSGGGSLLGGGGEELTGDVFLSPHVQLFTVNNNCLFSMVQLPALCGPGGGVAGFATPSSEVSVTAGVGM